MGRELDRGASRALGRRGRRGRDRSLRSSRDVSGAAPQRSVRRRETLRAVEDTLAQPGDGAERVRLKFLPDGAEVRVPSGTPVFDAASWNGIAIDSTCGGYGTCKKCRVRIAVDPPAPSSLDLRAYTPQEINDGWRLACRTPATR
ncbi:MAG: 2Fe-2S iron-sulfur cluster binding domain-containing protein, partial [Acidobacteriota bacterium]|nr:2Fe-2S iron-sulfur cluster binding domain-containing protein [Acidobacteriota bacterium]